MSSNNQFILLAVDTVGIQKYIFNSNRLRENIGASYLVASITGHWAFDAVQAAVKKIGGNHNVISNDGELNDATIDQATTIAEVLYSGGGNFVVLFRNIDAEKVFTATLSRRALKEAPGLRLIIHSVPFIWGQDVFRDKLKQLFREMKEKRGTLQNVMPMAGLGVTVMCRSTALPAVGMAGKTSDDDQRPASAEVLSKLHVADNANRDLEDHLSPGDGYAYPLDFDDLGRTYGESSLIAIVHADGDGIGKKIESIGDSYPSPIHVRKHINALRRFSLQVAQSAQTALAGTLRQLQQTFIDSEAFAHLLLGKRDQKDRVYLPFRPLIFGGDDVTFVSDGRIGLALTLEYLRQFQSETKRLLDESLTASAGVAIVKSHYPFARAYELAEELSKSAKAYRRQHAQDQSCLDWHFTTGGLYGGLSDIREREYKVNEGSMTLRPVTAVGDGVRSWETIQSGLKAFQSEKWQDKRNKAKALREKLRGGQETVKQFKELYGQTLPQIDGFEHVWADGYCGYFDAIELMDLYLPLAEGTTDEINA